MSIDLNLAGESYAHSLIAAGKVDRNAAWSFSAEDGNALLGKGGDDWDSYSKVHLGLDRSANDKTKARFKFPVAKDGKLFRSGVIAAKQRAAQQGDSAVEKAAGAILEQIDKPKSFFAFERKASAFEYKFVEGDGASAGAFEGYGSVFNNEDDGGDVMLPGAFEKTLNAHNAANSMPKMLLNHGSMGGAMFGGNDPMADLPIGKWTKMAEDSHGLQVKGRLISLDTERGKNIYGAMKEGELSGLSIGYRAKDFIRGTKPNEPRRQLKAVDLIEVSPVTFPMNARAGINVVKSARDITTIRDFENFLRDVGGFSNAAAKAIAACGYKAFTSEPRDEDGIGEAIAGPIQELVDKIRSSI
jgi:HK97 family phage prohead protease